MMRRDKGRRSDLPLTADINVTSLVDVAFTLLVIFIITAPILQGGVEVNVPQADVRPLTAEDDPFFVSVAADGTVFVDETPVPIESFEATFGQLMAAGTVQRVYIRADSMANWAPVLQVIATVSESGVHFGLVGEPMRGN